MNRQSLEKQREMYKSLTEIQLKIVEEYFANDMRNLRKICDPIIFRKGVPQMDWDDLYAVASDTLVESLISYDNSKGNKFHTYLTGNINRAFYDWTRDKHRGKRCNVLRDKNGKILKDENNNVVIVPNISIDAPTEDGINSYEKIASSLNISLEISEQIDILSENKMEKYFERLSKIQRKIATLLSEGYKPSEIREKLHITEKEYSNHMVMIKAYENISILF